MADAAVKADDTLVPLIEDGIQGNGGLAGLAVPQNEFPLAATDGNQGIHDLEAGLERDRHRGPVHNGGGIPFHRQAGHGLNRPQVIQGTPQTVHHPAQEGFAHGHVQDPPGALDFGAGF